MTRKLTLRDILATLAVAAVIVPFIGYSVRGCMPFVHDPGAWPASASPDSCSRSPHWAAMRSARAQIPIRAMFLGAAGV